MARDTGASPRKTAERAAADLIKARAALVGNAAAALEHRRQAETAHTDAVTAYATAYHAAIDGGWTATELAQLGREPATPPDTGARRPRRAGPPPPGGPRPDAEIRISAPGTAQAEPVPAPSG